jgi:hypothetical protein
VNRTRYGTLRCGPTGRLGTRTGALYYLFPARPIQRRSRFKALPHMRGRAVRREP